MMGIAPIFFCFARFVCLPCFAARRSGWLAGKLAEAVNQDGRADGLGLPRY